MFCSFRAFSPLRLGFAVVEHLQALFRQRQGAGQPLHGRLIVYFGDHRPFQDRIPEGRNDLHELAVVGCHGVEDRATAPQHDAVAVH